MTDMKADLRISRGGFVVIKLLVNGTVCLLVRKNLKWRDLNLIGGHEKDRDQGRLIRAAQRELWEEVPSIRDMSDINLEPLTKEVRYGPVLSRSAGLETNYEVQFFLLRIGGNPTDLLDNLGARTLNVLVPQEEILRNDNGRVSGLISFLDRTVPGGIPGIALSSSLNLKPVGRWAEKQQGQLQFAWL
jgi:hypothetical protein